VTKLINNYCSERIFKLIFEQLERDTKGTVIWATDFCGITEIYLLPPWFTEEECELEFKRLWLKFLRRGI